MRINRSKFAAAGVASLAALAIGGTGLQANAVQADPLSVLDTAAQQLGAATGGHYLDSAGKPVVTVLNKADAARVEASGATAKLVRHSFAQLTSAKQSLDTLRGIKSAGWGLDASTNQVVVDLYDATPKADAKRVEAAAAKFGDMVRVQHHAGSLSLFIKGGDEITNGQASCSNGFNVEKGGQKLLLSAGHCEKLGGGGPWNGGNTVDSIFPDEDSMLVENASGVGPSQINDGTTITSFADATQGEPMKRAGITSGVTSGKVTKLDYTFSDGTYSVYHEFCTDAKSDHGDSGGPAYDGGKGLGTLTGGDTTTSCFFPATVSAKRYGVTLPTS